MGANLIKARHVGCDGACRSSTMMVTMIAITPSLKASKRLVVISPRDMGRNLSRRGNLIVAWKPQSAQRDFIHHRQSYSTFPLCRLLLRHTVHRAEAPD